jgi:hypothetical protein
MVNDAKPHRKPYTQLMRELVLIYPCVKSANECQDHMVLSLCQLAEGVEYRVVPCIYTL